MCHFLIDSHGMYQFSVCCCNKLPQTQQQTQYELILNYWIKIKVLAQLHSLFCLLSLGRVCFLAFSTFQDSHIPWLMALSSILKTSLPFLHPITLTSFCHHISFFNSDSFTSLFCLKLLIGCIQYFRIMSLCYSQQINNTLILSATLLALFHVT